MRQGGEEAGGDGPGVLIKDLWPPLPTPTPNTFRIQCKGIGTVTVFGLYGMSEFMYGKKILTYYAELVSGIGPIFLCAALD